MFKNRYVRWGLVVFTSSLFRVIDGGNHAQWGDYGVQGGDGIPSISSFEQKKLLLLEL
jgi:hypothetical protein